MKYTDLDLFFLWGPLHNELLSADKISDINEKGRIQYRTFFNMVESVSYRVRQILLSRYQNEEINLEYTELIILKGENIELNRNGKIAKKEKHYPFLQLFKFTVLLYASKYDKTEICENFFATNGFESFQKALQIRNKLIHPKSVKDINIHENEYHFLENSREWFHEFMISLFENDLIIE